MTLRFALSSVNQTVLDYLLEAQVSTFSLQQSVNHVVLPEQLSAVHFEAEAIDRVRAIAEVACNESTSLLESKSPSVFMTREEVPATACAGWGM